MKNIFDKFTNRASVSKTLRFKLIPTESTKRNIAENGILDDDAARNRSYAGVKNRLDDYHRSHIAQKLGTLDPDWSELHAAYVERNRDEKASKGYKSVQKEYRARISDYLKSGADLTPKTIIKDLLKEEPDNEDLKRFDRFATYFENYRINRENMYAVDGDTSIANRLINDNFPRFARNIALFAKLDGEFVSRMDKSLHDDGILYDGIKLIDLFDTSYFSHVLTQEGIDFYNSVLGGIADDENKRQGVNEYCNLEFQQGRLEKVRFFVLYKQILNDRDTRSFIPQAFESDEEVSAAIMDYSDVLTDYDFSAVEDIMDGDVSPDGIFIDKKQISALSKILYDNDWSRIGSCLQTYAGRLPQREAKALLSKSVYSLRELHDCTERTDILSVVRGALKERVAKLGDDRAALMPMLRDIGRIQSYDAIKEMFDDVGAVESIIKIFAMFEEDGDAEFYDRIDEANDILRDGIKLQNKVRNYATKKAAVPQKIKLNFNSVTLANGWDKGKENDNLAVIFIKDGRYYLGIKNKDDKPSFEIGERSDTSKPCYMKMEYRLLPGPNKMIPKVAFADANRTKYEPSTYILNGYKAGKHKKGDNFDLAFCRDLIDYFKHVIEATEYWNVFGFRFSPTNEYSDLSGFYNEISERNYNVKLVPVDADYIDSLDRDGKLYMFEIYNKDLSEHSTGKKNLHTLYWQELFAERNLRSGNIKLSGGAELFYRPADTGNAFSHKKGDILIRKTNDDGTPVDDKLHSAAMKDANLGDIEMCKQKYPSLKFRYAPHEIKKNKRYFEDQFSFHVPITLNSKARGAVGLNEEVIKTVAESDCNVMGIDRGERNLLYVCIVDRTGNILYQRSLNEIAGVDYNAKLTSVAALRDDQRKSWHAIQQIKNVKAGYLSAAIHEITELMLKYNAILVMENLNMGFKRGRTSIEKQVYQNFEKSLIEKMNYLADKTKDPYEAGGIANGYQLTEPFDSFKRMNFQTGFVFYVPAAYTSRIDPCTGFVDLFSRVFPRDITMKSARENLSKFKAIVYNHAEDSFEFSFDYADFGIKAGSITAWTVGTCGDGRIDKYKDKNGRFQSKVVKVTEEIKALFDRYGVERTQGDLREKICSVGEKAFYDRLIHLLRLTVSLRYEDAEHDFILSPVVGLGKPFDSREHVDGLPFDGDANGAYHIALQGLRMIGNIENGKIKWDDKGEANNRWFAFAQETARKKREK